MIRIKGIQGTSLLDFPGMVSTVIWVSGCNFRCPFCQNPELVTGPAPKTILRSKFFSRVKKNLNLIDGVVITGGEPTIHPDLPDFIKQLKELGLKVKLDTNGANPVALRKVLPLVDYVAMDVKAPPEKYGKASGVPVDVKKIEKSIHLIKESGKPYEFRTTVVPGLTNYDDIKAIAKWIGPAKKYALQQFSPKKTIDKEYRKRKPFSKWKLNQMKKVVKKRFKSCEVRA